MKIIPIYAKPEPKLWSAQWYFAQPVRYFDRFWQFVANAESGFLDKAMTDTPIRRPIYISGIARAGTTITLEILHKHPDVGVHHYIDMVQPYLPFIWNRLRKFMPLPKGMAQERPHRDGLMMTPDNPEALEEIFWYRWFPHMHDENFSHVLDESNWNRQFNAFYRAHIKKLLIARAKSRYATKNNYHITRLAYLIRLFPDARFVLVIRDPRKHMISYLKQQNLLSNLYHSDSRWWKIARELGHYEFGEHMQFINCGDTRAIQQIRRLWNQERRIEAFGHYWRDLYQYLADTLDSRTDIRKAACVVRHEDLCTNPTATIDRILDHCNLDKSSFRPIRDAFAEKLRPPAYYQASLSPDETDLLWDIVGHTAQRFGYNR